MQYRIGERDPNTGLYNVIHPDGSITLNGIKIYNAETQVGDVVQATRRSDGMLILDGVAAAESSRFVEPQSYLDGQVWNREAELSILSLQLLSGDTARSREELVLRVKLERAISKDLRVSIFLAGLAEYGTDYTIVDDPGTIEEPDDLNEDADERIVGIIIRGGRSYKDVRILVADKIHEIVKPLIFTLTQALNCKIRSGTIGLAIVPRRFWWQIWTSDGGQFSLSEDRQYLVLSVAALAEYENAWTAATSGTDGNVSFASLSLSTNSAPGQFFAIFPYLPAPQAPPPPSEPNIYQLYNSANNTTYIVYRYIEFLP